MHLSRIDLNLLVVFDTVITEGSITAAGRKLNLSQPAVTKAIASLEETLGCKLFHRVANGVEATVHGIAFAPRAVAVFDEMRVRLGQVFRTENEVLVFTASGTGVFESAFTNLLSPGEKVVHEAGRER